MRIGYARVSGLGQSLTEQVAQLKDAGCQVIYEEVFTGTTADRPEFQATMAVLEAGDVLVVTKLDRFARSASDAITHIRALMKRGVAVHILNMGVVEDTTTGRLLLTILSGFAEFERDMIVERLAEGKAAARAAGTLREGRPRKYAPEQMEHAMTLLETNSYTEVERLTGISKATLTRYKRKQKRV
ncbi:resolvase [Sporosarcina ureae]|uniref:recombinase family protein n=1 Tax=Sporosarcina ureae TaxID=1571 RepID=UPI000A153569|nr:recombinase family protein [Sporosarcina ureae]ARJ39880.1 resolvase [Sporosarcina ureae]